MRRPKVSSFFFSLMIFLFTHQELAALRMDQLACLRLPGVGIGKDRLAGYFDIPCSIRLAAQEVESIDGFLVRPRGRGSKQQFIRRRWIGWHL